MIKKYSYSTYHKKYWQKHKTRLNKERRKRYLKNKAHENALSLKYYKKHKLQILKYLKHYAQKHKEEKRIYSRNYKRTRRMNDINYKLRDLISTRIRIALKINVKKSLKTKQLLGCSILYLKQYLEQQFTKKMNWTNHGSYWEIDHIKPCARFDMNKIKEQQKCFHYTNLQPLKAEDNRRKWANV